MTTAYFDCFAGAAGDMIVGALLSAGADFQRLSADLSRLGAGSAVRREDVHRGGIAGVKFHVDAPHHEHEHDHHHGRRGLTDILGLISAAALPARAAKRATDIFTRLAKAEAKVHATAIENVHFHEVGAFDSIADIVGACLAMEYLDVDTVICSPIPTGGGTVQTAHGLLPVPAPATAELLVGFPLTDNGAQFECTTPTAAAILTTLASSFGAPPAMQVAAVGYGAGSRIEGPLPNLLRVMVGAAGEASADAVVELIANIDDCTGEMLSAAVAALLAAGCLDAWATPIYMKKSRPAWMLSALCRHGDVAAAEEVFFRQTTTFGVRKRAMERTMLQRRHESMETPFGPVRVKLGVRGGHVVTAAPEFEDCAAAARAHHVAVRDVIFAASEAWHKRQAQTPR
jgi:uncharacterized protein (TIGR00299 family) protein